VSKKEWKPLEFDECFNCGNSLEVFTEDGEITEQGQMVTGGDEVRCIECGEKGCICADEETPAYISWYNN
jgi:hypothetical protein